MARGGDRLRHALTLGGRSPPAVSLLLAALVTATVGATLSAQLDSWLALDPHGGWQLLQVWRYLTWPFNQAPFLENGLTLIFAGYSLVWTGRMLVDVWGARLFLLRVLYISAGAGVISALMLAPLDLPVPVRGIWPLTIALLVCWGLSFPNIQVGVFVAVRMSGLKVAQLAAVGTPVWALALGPLQLGPLERLAVYLPNLAALLLAWLLVGSTPRRGWRRFTERWRQARLRRARSRFEVIDPGPRGPRQWLN